MIRVLEVIEGMLLGVLCIEDHKRKEISLITTIIFSMSCFLEGLFKVKNQNMTLQEMGIGACLGFILIGLSLCNRQQLGMGDGIIVTFLGLAKGMHNITLLSIASVLAGLYGIYLLLVKKADKSATFPFIPSITMGYALTMIRI